MKQASTKTKAKTGQESSDRAPSVDELRNAYDRNDGNVAATARDLGLSSSWTRDLLVANDIHELQELGLAHRLENELEPDDIGQEAAL